MKKPRKKKSFKKGDLVYTTYKTGFATSEYIYAIVLSVNKTLRVADIYIYGNLKLNGRRKQDRVPFSYLEHLKK